MRPRLTYANVIATIALFIALGGSAYAFHLGRNSVGSKQLKMNAVTTAKIKEEAVTGAKVAKGTITGTQINLSTLGTVPSATDAHNAANAQTLDGQSADQLTSASKLHCPAGTQLVAGVCFETASRPAVDFNEALETCASAGRSLPSAGELDAYLLTLPKNAESWGGSAFDSEFHLRAPIYTKSDEGLSFYMTSVEDISPYFCVTGPTN
jgi:hypothetical protein